MPIERETRGTLHETTQLGTAEILRERRQFLYINILSHNPILLHLASMDVKDLNTTHLIWQGDLDVDLETTGSKECIVDHVFPVGHTDDEDVVELLNTIHLM